MSSAGVVEHLDKTPERWAFLLRADDGTALNVELRGKVVGTLADGNAVELLESRTIAADEVVVARRLRNVSLGSMVTARQPGRGSKLAAFLMPQSIWTPVGGVGAAVIGYVTAGSANKSAAPPDATDTPAPVVPGDGGGFPVLVVVLVAVVLVAVAIALVVRRREPPTADPAPAPAPRAASGRGALVLMVVAGLLVGALLNLVIT